MAFVLQQENKEILFSIWKIGLKHDAAKFIWGLADGRWSSGER